MSIKKKIASFLSKHKPQPEEPESQAAPEPIPESAPEAQPVSEQNEALLALSADHPINTLYNQRRQEAGYLPAPRVCLDEDGELPPEMARREVRRLQSALKTVCASRVKEASGKAKHSPRKNRKNGKQEEEAASADAPAALPDLDALPYIFLSSDKLYAWIIIFPPIRKGKELSREMLLETLGKQGISYGVNTRLLDRLAHDDSRYFHLYLLAKGKPAFDGKNGNIVDNYPRVIERILEVNEYNQVDYTSLNLIYNVEQGQEICHLIKPTEGEPGRTVDNQELPAKSGRSVPLPKGRNTEISEDGTQLLASIAGHVEFSGRSFQVKPVLDIKGDVDFSTGNLNFLGDINIQGDVLSGFTVRASGNINVAGVVEAGSTVEAGGDLVVVKGILGDGITTAQSLKSVFSKFIENATVCARENIQTDCIVGSGVYCGGEVLVRSGRGAIMGGRIWAAHKISAKSVGSPSECKSSIVLGGRPCVIFEQEAARREVNALEMELEKLECQPDSPTKSSLIGKVKIKLAAAGLKLQRAKKTLDEQAEAREDVADDGRLECDVAYPGTKITFGDQTLRLHQASRFCVIRQLEGEIVIM